MVESIYEAVVKSNKLTELSRDDFLSVYSSSTGEMESLYHEVVSECREDL